MKTQIFQKEDLEEIHEAIALGKVIAFPTDTVFGVGVSFQDEEALKRLKMAKRRDAYKPIPLMVSTIEQIEEIAYLDKRSMKLVHTFMPGSLTLILKKKEHIPKYINDGLDSIAIRMPNDPFLLSILSHPMLVSSANLSGETPGKNMDEVLKQLEGKIDGIVAGEAKENIASTIVDMSKEQIKFIRIGSLSEEQIRQVIEEDER